MEETIQQRTVFQEKVTGVFIDSENAVAVLYVNELKGHAGSTFQGVFIAAGRTETGMTAERNIFEITAGRAGIHGTTKRRVATINHFFYIFDDRVTRMLNINHFLKMVFKNLLQNIHKTIMRENEKKRNP